MCYIDNQGPLSKNYINQITKVIDRALNCHHRTLAVRVDLHLPDSLVIDDIPDEAEFARTDSAVISRFIDSLKAKISADMKRKHKAGKRVHPCAVRIIWVMEFGPESQKRHYHVVLLLNKDAYAGPGDYKKNEGTLASMIMRAWNSALDVPYPEYKTLVYFPDNCYYHLYHDEAFSENPFKNIIYRASYLTKLQTKRITKERRSFGCSQS